MESVKAFKLAKSHGKKLLKLFDDEEFKFRLFTGLKMTSIPLLSLIILSFLIFILVKLDAHFFKANEIIGIDNFDENFYDAISDYLLNSVPYMACLLIFVNILALYVSSLLLRPFRLIGEYCEKKLNGEEASYDPEFFTDLKLLTRFAEFFFTYIDIAEKQGVLKSIEIPEKYKRIHKPVFETAFFIQFMFFILISLLVVSTSVYAFGFDLNEGVMDLAYQMLGSDKPKINYYLHRQSEVVDLIILGVLVSHVLMYGLLAVHLYLKVSGPAFGIFATMRSFLKGRYNARVHLVGFYYLRPQCRKLNKYLDYVQKNLVKD